jgi:formamidopyrimidine-DNA glycosylase
MSSAQNDVAGIGNIYLKDHLFPCKMSTDEIFGIRTYTAGKALTILAHLQLILGQ